MNRILHTPEGVRDIYGDACEQKRLMLESIMDKFAYLRIGLSVLLTFIGVKMFLPLVGIEIGIAASLVVIVSILTLSILLSVLFPPKKAEANS